MNMFKLNKFSLIILTRCDLRCRLCCEYVPQNKPFPDMTVPEAEKILSSVFDVADYIETLHLTGGGEPFLHPELADMIKIAMQYSQQFGKLMLFTNSTISISDKLLSTLKQYKDKILVQTSQYGLMPDKEKATVQRLQENGIACKVEKYYGENQSFGGWVDFGKWESHKRTPQQLTEIFHACAITRCMKGNWRTRDGKVHWCSRSQRGMDLGLLPDVPDDYVDLLDASVSIEEKRAKFEEIANKQCISACDYCSGDEGTDDQAKRFPAAEQLQ